MSTKIHFLLLLTRNLGQGRVCWKSVVSYDLMTIVILGPWWPSDCMLSTVLLNQGLLCPCHHFYMCPLSSRFIYFLLSRPIQCIVDNTCVECNCGWRWFWKGYIYSAVKLCIFVYTVTWRVKEIELEYKFDTDKANICQRRNDATSVFSFSFFCKVAAKVLIVKRYPHQLKARFVFCYWYMCKRITSYISNQKNRRQNRWSNPS